MTPRGTHNAETVLAHVFADTHRVMLGGYSQRTNNAKKREKMHQFAHPSITYPSNRRDDEWTQKGIMA